MRSDWLLFLHILSALMLVAGVIAVSLTSLAAARSGRPEQVPLLRAIAFRTNLVVVFPMFIAVHVFGGLLSDREYKDSDPDWLSIGFAITSIATIVAVLLILLQ